MNGAAFVRWYALWASFCIVCDTQQRVRVERLAVSLVIMHLYAMLVVYRLETYGIRRYSLMLLPPVLRRSPDFRWHVFRDVFFLRILISANLFISLISLRNMCDDEWMNLKSIRQPSSRWRRVYGDNSDGFDLSKSFRSKWAVLNHLVRETDRIKRANLFWSESEWQWSEVEVKYCPNRLTINWQPFRWKSLLRQVDGW